MLRRFVKRKKGATGSHTVKVVDPLITKGYNKYNKWVVLIFKARKTNQNICYFNIVHYS